MERPRSSKHHVDRETRKKRATCSASGTRTTQLARRSYTHISAVTDGKRRPRCWATGPSRHEPRTSRQTGSEGQETKPTAGDDLVGTATVYMPQREVLPSPRSIRTRGMSWSRHRSQTTPTSCGLAARPSTRTGNNWTGPRTRSGSTIALNRDNRMVTVLIPTGTWVHRESCHGATSKAQGLSLFIRRQYMIE